ncbi:acyl transferase/acyl hydrolase/lysophospholipase [Ilyonectria robusta]|uniref:acyl transferase/acyl hydrolase/lysophospholipase n=1 Tax=Ilyonectria robusta TaxID=1079257 RepID=UPI001E8E5AAC|nr:acyl transferase/acyl hydrolase/lysophospholipase [Ilyonectria robusta]KAH8654869.1 acyl transferase/acyl hydrolase/lysophospholipase [Ilyonectria robusta]
MADLLVQARSVPAIHSKPNKSAAKPNTKAKRPPSSKPTPAPGVVATLQKALKDANNAYQWCKDGLTEQERERKRLVEQRRQILCAKLQDADTRTQWDAAAQELDVLEGNEEWKKDSSTGDYNPDLIEERLQALDKARANCDTRTMMHLIRTALSRDLGGMDNVDLYRHSYSGTKHLIERYVESTIQTIEAVVTQSQLDHGIEHRDLLDGILFARQSYGRSALLLSGGGTFGMAHIGVLKCLFEAKLLPRIISGASAGSIVCAAMCTRTDEQIPELIKEFPYGDLSVFEDPSGNDGVWDNLRRLLTEGSWSDIKHLSRVMQGLIGDMTFQEAYNRTRRILNICVSTASVYELPRLLNYVTAPNVMIWSAVAASCSVPLVFNASPLLVKEPATGEHKPWNPTPQHWIDGSVDNDLPMTRLSEMFNVNHFIVSQVNPHVVPFLSRDDHLSPTGPLERDRSTRTDDLDWVCTLTSLAKDEALHRLHFLAEIGIMPNLVTKFRSILSQKYSGDINILPEINMNDLPRLMRNPTSEFMIRACLLGERATWPKLSRIRDRCAIELALDHAVHRLRARVIFSESQRDLRRMHTGRGKLMFKGPEPPMASSVVMGSSLEMKSYKRHRRQSGGSLQLADRWNLLDSAITDDETEQEERLEMQSRRSRAGSPVALRKPRLKRASRSQIHIQMRELHVNLAEVDDCDFGVDFSKPLTPPSHLQARDKIAPSIQDVVLEESGTATPDPWSDHTWRSRGNFTSPAEDAETSEAYHSSDGIREDTDASDPEPYEAQPRDDPSKSSQSSGNISPFRPEERAGWVLWD